MKLIEVLSPSEVRRRALELQAQLLKEGIEPLSKRVMLYFQTRALEYETGPNFDVEAELMGSAEGVNDHPILKIRFPEHYEFDIDVKFFQDDKTKLGMGGTRIRATVDDRNDDGGVSSYIMLQTPDNIHVYIDGGLLSDGSNSKDCLSWEAAIDFFMREIDKRIKEIWATPGSHSPFE